MSRYVPIAVISAFLSAAILAFGSFPAAAGTVSVKASTLTDHDRCSSEWHFVINQLADGQAPASITVTWSGGSSSTLDLWKVSGPVAHYTTTEHLDLAVTGATAEIAGEWSGQFNLSHGPCPAVELTSTPVVAATPTPTPTEEVGVTAPTPTPTVAGTQQPPSGGPPSSAPPAVVPPAPTQAGFEQAPTGNVTQPAVAQLPSTSTAAGGPLANALVLFGLGAAGALLARRRNP